MSNRRALLLVTASLAVAALLSGCGLIASIPGVGAPAAPPAIGPVGPATIQPGPGGGTGGNVGGGANGGSGTGAGGGTGTGTGVGPGGGNGLPGEPTIVVPHPGQANLRVISPVELRSRIDATGHVIVRVRWWGGIEPCEVLDSVAIARDGTTITITARVGAAPGPPVACIEIARDTATLVDLGVLGSGSWVVRAAAGDATPITVIVP